MYHNETIYYKTINTNTKEINVVPLSAFNHISAFELFVAIAQIENYQTYLTNAI